MRPCFTYHRFITLYVTILLTGGLAYGQISPGNYSFPNNHLDWFTLEGDHFLIHYQTGNEEEAVYSLLLAEQVYRPITELYSHTPAKKVSIVLRDRTDYSNGAAYFFDDKIEVWLPPLNSPFRGSHVWLRNVITHEFAHIVQLGASMRRTQRIPAVYLQWLSYEDVRRPDILYGYPKTIITHPFATVSIPAWFAEGTAQFQRDSIYYDYWDSHRDMMLRMAILSGKALELNDMSHFSSKTSREREMVYNQGFDFSRYIAGRFGENVLAQLTQSSSDGPENFNRVMEGVTGVAAKELYTDWIQERNIQYRLQTGDLDPQVTLTIESEGFLNFFPQFEPNGKFIGYLSNRGRDFAQTKLVLASGDSTLEVRDLGPGRVSEELQGHHGAISASSNIALDLVSTRFSFSPDGDRIVYSKRGKNRFGEQYNDLYLYQISSAKTRKLTDDARVHDPAWHASEELVAAVQYENGTHSLILYNIEADEIRTVRKFEPGQTIYTPVWSPDGSFIYFASARSGKRSIHRFQVNRGDSEPILELSGVDFRDPWVDPENQYLYFSSDHKGIFNIYRQSIESGEIQKLTDRLGGAFMPFAKGDSLYFSDYRADGYKVASIPLSEFANTFNASDWRPANHPPDLQSLEYDYKSLDEVARNVRQTIIESNQPGQSVHSIPVKARGVSLDEIKWQPFDQATTGLSVTPVLRFDNYSKLNGSNSNLIRSGELGEFGENILRDLKTGAYFSTRNVLENVSLFGGALFGFGSRPVDGFSNFFSPGRFNNLDRDLFFIVERNGLPFIKRSWSPTISLELYNIQRNVADGLTIEEFPCTSCLPEEKSIDIRYRIWEANLFLRSKLNRWSLLEMGASYSPSTVVTDGFFSEEFRQFIPGSSTEYFRGSGLSLRYIADLTRPTIHEDIVPEGVFIETGLAMERGELLERYELNEGSLDPVYKTDINYSGELDVLFGFTIRDQTKGMISTRGFAYFNRPEDYFYLDYNGGLSGMRSYPYFAIGGQRTHYSRFSFLTPIKTGLNRQLGAYTFDKLYGHLFFEAGNGWGGPLEIGNNLKTGIGAELRLSLQGYYNYPLKFFINAAYGFNRFDVSLPDSFIRISGSDRVEYGRELLFYVGLTFDFNRL